MKKVIIVLVISLGLTSCDWFNKSDDSTNEADSAKDVVLGGDKDKDGCLASAGYTWSKLNKECIRVFSGIQLMPVEVTDDATLCAYILFDESGDNAELFLPNQDESEILTRAAQGKPWMNKEWQLIPYKGYQVKKDGKLLYSGDGEIGNRVSGSDDSEEIDSTQTK